MATAVTRLPTCAEELNELLSKSTGALGIALIIANDYKTSSNIPPLEGTLKDASKAQNVFESLNTICYMKCNSTASQMSDAISAIASCSSYPKAFKWIVFIFSGHGSDNQVILGQDNQKVKIDDILVKFQPSQNSKTATIPKILLFDACRGGGITGSILIPRAKGHACKSALRVPEKGNMLVGYSTLPLRMSYEHNKKGGIWMSHLLDRLGRDERSINDILTATNGDIIEYFQQREVEIQQPECYNTLWSIVNLKQEAIKAKKQGIKFIPNTSLQIYSGDTAAGISPPSTPGNPPLSTPDLSHVKIKSNIGRNMWKQELKNIIVDQLGMEALKYECDGLGKGFCCTLSHSLFAKPIMSGEHRSKQEAEQNAAKKAYKEIEIMKKQ